MRSADRVSPEEEVAMMSAESGKVPDELLNLAKQAAAPQLTETALAKRLGPRSTWSPAVGQLWRAALDEVTTLVMLLDVGLESVTVVPVTIEPIVAPTDAVVVGGSAVGLPITIWADLRRSLPVAVLDRPIDDLGFAALQQVQAAVARSREQLPALAETNDMRAELDDDLAALATATGAAPSIADPTPLPAGIDLDAVDPEALEAVAERLEVALPVVLDLIDGKRRPTAEEASVLREALGGLPETKTPPAGLVVELAQPRWRGLVRQRRHGHPTEHDARIALAYEVNTMAARQTGERDPSWPDRIRRWAQAHQLDIDAEP
jgi:hypothetical protein